jgi:K(+)-stimulated pyrophosphate-energized sodium pump
MSLRRITAPALAAVAACFAPAAHASSEANLVLPRLADASVVGVSSTALLGAGIGVALLGIVVGMVMFAQLKALPVHAAMLEISELIYETCKTYVFTQAAFIAKLWALIAVVVVAYFGWLAPVGAVGVVLILAYSILGILGSVAIAWFGMRVNCYANSRSAFAALMGRPYPAYAIPLKAGMSIGLVLISMALFIMLATLLLVPPDLAPKCFIGFAVGTSLGASALRIAGGIFTKIADVGSDLMKIVFNIKEDDARNPGVIADCAGDNAGDSVGPTADGFETYGVTAVALITFIVLAVAGATMQTTLLTWIFFVAAATILTSLGSYFACWAYDKARFEKAAKMDFEAALTRLVWVTSIVSIVVVVGITYWMLGDLGGGDLWWRFATIVCCGTLAGALIPEVVKVFTSTKSGHVREIVDASRQGASLNVLSGIIAGNYAAYWLGMCIFALMGVAYWVSADIPTTVMLAPGIFAFGLLAFGFLSMGPVTIAVDSYGPVSDNAQSVFELSLVETLPGFTDEVKGKFGFDVDFEKGKGYLEDNDAAGNTFKATAKPVLIGTAVVGATTLIFSVVVNLTNALTTNTDKLSLLYPPFLLGLILGGSVIFWFSGAATQAVATGAFRAVEFIKANIKLDTTSNKANIEDSKKVVAICTKYAQDGTTNIFLAVFFAALSFAFLNEWLFIGYLVAIALFGLFQANYMANAGGAWDNAKKLVEVELRMKGTELHAATVVGDTVGDPYKDTSSVAMNPVIKFTSLFGLLAVELAVGLGPERAVLRAVLSAVFFLVASVFIWRSFYGMRIGGGLNGGTETVPATTAAADEKAKAKAAA